MSTLRAAADLLANATSIAGLSPIAAAVGCSPPPETLDEATRLHLGIGPPVLRARVASGTGTLRALLLEVSADAALRDVVPRIAAKLASRAPHALWLLLATHNEGGNDIAIAAWSGERTRPRVAALIADRRRLVDSDAEALRALIATRGDDDLLAHARWVEILGREALTRRFYRALERVVGEMARSASAGRVDDRAQIALLYVSRFIFLAFLEAKGWLDGDRAFLIRRFDQCMAMSGGFHRRVALPLFFGTLNTPAARRAPAARRFGCVPFLNGGLFARAAVERRAGTVVFTDEAYGVLLHDLFAQYRFTAREESASWSEAAVDPEMLGKAFESLMASTERQASGAYFTPYHLVQRVAGSGLQRVLARAVGDRAADQLLRGEPIEPDQRQRARARLEQLAILDPACGSGAFLVHSLEQVSDLLGQLGDDRPLDRRRRSVLTRSIFGVDVNPTAVWLCELRLWLSVVIETDESEARHVKPLPNLDHNIRIGDALTGRAFGDAAMATVGGDELRLLRHRYASASGVRKRVLARQLQTVERRRALAAIDAEIAAITSRRRELVSLRRGHDLFGDRHVPSRDERIRALELRRRSATLRATRRRVAEGGSLPFTFPAHFADVDVRGGFDLIVGNPPWVRLHRIPPAARARFRHEYFVARAAAWEPGADVAAAPRGFGAQVDLAALFVERSIRLLAPEGALALLLPVKLWHSLAGGGMRRFIAAETDLCQLEDFSNAGAAFEAAVYPSLLVAQRRGRSGRDRGSDTSPPCLDAAIHGSRAIVRWRTPPEKLSFDDSPGAPWVVLPPDARRAFDAIREAGVPLAESVLGRPYLGVKCGCNDAFIVRADPSAAEHGDLVAVRDRNGRTGFVERDLLRPLVRGEDLNSWCLPTPEQFIIWTHDARDLPLPELPPFAARWLGPWRRQLAARADARRAPRWWSVFRTESARCDRPRVVWADMGRSPRASFISAEDDTVALNSCYLVRCRSDRDAFAFAALLNSPVAAAWLGALAEPARGNYRRYLGWTMSLLPIPIDWQAACDILAPLGEKAVRDSRAPSTHDLVAAALKAYALSERVVAPLVAWMSSS